MNTRRSNHKLKATGTASVADRTALREEDFLRVIWHERKRAERCQKPCLLMLVEMESQFPLERNGKALATVLSALSAATGAIARLRCYPCSGRQMPAAECIELGCGRSGKLPAGARFDP